MVVEGLDFASEEDGGVAAAAAGTFGLADIEDLVHAGVESCGLEGVAEFIDDGEEDFVHFWVERAIAAAIEVVVVGPNVFYGVFYPGCFVEFGIGLQQLAGMLFPALVAEHVYLRDDADLFF